MSIVLKKGEKVKAVLPFFSIVLIAAAAAVHETWGVDGEEDKKEERHFNDSCQEAAYSHLIPVYKKHKSST